MFYATLAEVRAELKADSTVGDSLVVTYLRQISERLDREFMAVRPVFGPWIEQREFLVEPTRIDSYYNTFRFVDPLLALTAAEVAGDTLTVGTTVEAWPTLRTPYRLLRIMDCGCSWYSHCTSDCAPPMVKITGTWGYHRNWDDAFPEVDTVQDALGINATVTTLTVADVDGTDEWGQTPRISTGNLLLIGTEYLEVTATNTVANTATVRRGRNGSTAAAHANGVAVAVFRPEDPIRRLVIRMAAKSYAKRGAFEATEVTDLGTITYPADWLMEARNIMQEYAYE